MNIFPAIDLYGGKVVRLYKGDYDKMTVYSSDPVGVACSFADAGAKYLHLVDLEGARSGECPNFEVIREIALKSGLKIEIGGGIRTADVIKRYLEAGVMRVILGTAAVQNSEFLESSLAVWGDRIAVGVDVRDGKVAVKGWTELSDFDVYTYMDRLQSLGVSTVICTDISKDGVLGGTNRELYRSLSEKYSIDIVASGGVTTAEDIKVLCEMKLYGAILGKALYAGKIDLSEAIKACRESTVI